MDRSFNNQRIKNPQASCFRGLTNIQQNYSKLYSNTQQFNPHIIKLCRHSSPPTSNQPQSFLISVLTSQKISSLPPA
ncbi:hypothetical protein HanRHA438_Chr15g0708171 [Helianthus annuus]|nr:hypothetical protein HanIR_Chr15g0756281 [Helianthus annuus]KAJ0844956.1 hypothetical protein HanRHA438_Chr15g0708171 [Helianthus annuus]